MYFLKASAQQIRKSNALSSLTGNLGKFSPLSHCKNYFKDQTLGKINTLQINGDYFYGGGTLILLFLLGLDIYDSESESSGSDSPRDDRRADSDEELKVR